ncbi:hypothetical protein [Edaphobacter dinghuensis]|nr:hypothetical protein [Edaphobacter dinghuensis]
MKSRWLGAMLSSVIAAAPSAWGQMHKVAKPQQVVRAVGVYEWTGDMAKPTASRLIPVSLFINGSLQDASVYMSQPVPFALETGNVYELEKAGISDGQIDLEFARKLQTADGDGGGWFGYGSFKPLAPIKKAPALRASKTLPVIVSSKDDSRPHFGKADGSAAPSSGTKDSGTKDSSASTKEDSGSSTADDSDRPTMIRRKPDADSSATTTTATTTSTTSASENNPEDDPDRPTLKRRTPAEAKKARDEAESSGTGAVESLNNDPDRPNLHYGRPAGSLTETELPKLVGMPANLHQMVAVSDAVDRDPHDFSRPWADGAERAAVLAKMEAMAQAKLAQYGGTPAPAAVPAATPKKTPVHGKVRHKAATAAAATPVVTLLDEQLKGYTLSYGGAATYIFMAHTAGTGAALRYVTVVAQADDLGELKPALQTVTDAAHLDRTPEMEFVDVVDADASNRASLLFELKAQSSRQFVLYRVIASEAQLIFAGGSIQ